MRADDPPPVATGPLVPVAQSQGHAGKALVIAAVAIVLIAVVTASPGETGIPYVAKNCLPWYS